MYASLPEMIWHREKEFSNSMADLWEQKFKPIHSSDHQTYGFQ